MSSQSGRLNVPRSAQARRMATISACAVGQLASSAPIRTDQDRGARAREHRPVVERTRSGFQPTRRRGAWSQSSRFSSPASSPGADRTGLLLFRVTRLDPRARGSVPRATIRPGTNPPGLCPFDGNDELKEIDVSHRQQNGALAFAELWTAHRHDGVQPSHAAIGDEYAPNAWNQALERA